MSIADRFRHRTPPPTGYYVYAYLCPVTEEPFYIGKGSGDRMVRHLRQSRRDDRPTFFHRKLNKMMRFGLNPIICIIKDNLSEEEAYASETTLIHLTGTRALGTGPLCNTRVDQRGAYAGYPLELGIKKGTDVWAWGKHFASLAAVERDPRCVVILATLQRRMAEGVRIELAATRQGRPKPPRIFLPRKPRPPQKPKRGRKVTCWGEEFISLAAIARDLRCVVTVSQLRNRLLTGWRIERAAETPIDQVAARRVKMVQ
jgi:hypothetical protein